MTWLPIFRALTVALGLALAPPAGAAPPVNSQGAYFQSLSSICSNTSSCTAIFAAIPAGKTLIARNASCRLHTPHNAVVSVLSVSGNGGTTFIPVGAAQITPSAIRYFYTSADIFMPFTAGQIPRAIFSSNVVGSHGIYCSLSGELKP